MDIMKGKTIKKVLKTEEFSNLTEMQTITLMKGYRLHFVSMREMKGADV